MKLKCGCEIKRADQPDAEVLFEEGETHRLFFCDTHHDEMVKLIKENGGYTIPDGDADAIYAGNLTIKALNAIEEHTLKIVQKGMDEIWEEKRRGMN